METLEILTKARALLAVPDQWTKESYARDKAYVEVNAGDETACAWCAVGAIRRICMEPKSRYLAVNEVEKILWKDESFINLEEFNDSVFTAHADIIGVFDRAIAELTQERDQCPST